MTWLPAFLARVRRRLRGLWLVATMVWFAPAVAGAAVVLVAAGRMRPWAWPEPAAIVLAGAAAVAIVVTALVLRVPDGVAARAADRGLGSRDGIATAVEIAPEQGPFSALVHERARAIATGADLRRALPLRVASRRLAAGGALGALALVGGVTGNPQDEVRRRQAADQAVIAEAAADVDAAAEALAEGLEPEDEAAIAAELEVLATALADATTLDEARDLLDRAEAALQAGLTPEALATKAAVSGLERSTAATPLPGAVPGDTAAAQLDAAADALSGLDDAGQADLAERLERLAETQAVGSPAAAGALARAAAALGAGDVGAAADALAEAARDHRAAGASAAADDQLRSALGTVDGARKGLDGNGTGNGQGDDGDGQGDGDGDGDGQGEGEGDGNGNGNGNGQGGDGDGQGDGDGDGNGQGNGGQGGENPSGGASGPVAGASGGNGAGQGGQGTAQGTPGADPVGDERRSDEPSLFDPRGSGDDEVALGGVPTGDDPGEVVGRGDGLSTTGSAFVPLSQALGSFRQRVTTALDDPALSPSMQELVRSYFGRLTEGGSR